MRLEQLERVVAESREQAAAIRAEAATLVREIDDIKKRISRPPAPVAVQRQPLFARIKATTWTRVAVLSMGGLVGVVAGFATWVRVANAPEPPPIAITQPAPLAADIPPAIEAPATPEPAPVTVRDEPRRAVLAVAQPVPVSYTGTLSVDAVPGGQVFINREAAGKTPLKVPKLRAGAHLVWIEREGYRRWTRVVEVPADRVTQLTASLEPLSR